MHKASQKCTDSLISVILPSHKFLIVFVLSAGSQGPPHFSRGFEAGGLVGCSEVLDPYNYDLARDFNVSLNQIIEINNDYGCFSMISTGLGFGIYPKIMVEKSTFPVKGIPFDVKTSTQISLGFRSYDSLSIAAKAFVDFVKDWEF